MTSTSSNDDDNTSTPPQLAQQSVSDFCTALASKQPTPGGGAAAAVGAALGGAAASMSAAYTQRKKDVESGAAAHATTLQAQIDITALLQMADDDQQAYQALQATWKKDCALTPDEIAAVQARALEVPTVLVQACHARIVAIHNFLPHCNSQITSDAKVGIHQLAGAARAAYQTVLVNNPSVDQKQALQTLLVEIHRIEVDLLELEL
eukprot:CAMPEP_0172471874 /NCGR_PEP_ID=MMETSP1065-20121228/68046_1 /TAXON_ID=265537 /ORGANISM="Amphiprora paludosa, Strain CCMP125" /LENGTH=206 /DNA_ID=CAMNT_0013229989 /DNA_START=80 /DNA_END=700 /DNA_ORIENTATION=+